MPMMRVYRSVFGYPARFYAFEHLASFASF